MKFFRSSNPAVIELISEKMKDRPGQTVERFKEGLRKWLADWPEGTFVGTAFEGSEPDEHKALKGFIVAIDEGGESSHVFVLEAWVDPEADPGLTDQVFTRLAFWVDQRGKREIRCETLQEPDMFHKKWGFKIFSRVLSYEIPENFGTQITKNLQEDSVGSSKELDNAFSQQRAVDGVDIRSKSEEDRGSARGADSKGAGVATESLRKQQLLPIADAGGTGGL